MTSRDAIANVNVSPVTLSDIPRIATLHARVFGPGRFGRTAYRIREGAPYVSRYCRQALKCNELLAAVSFTMITIGGEGNALLLGPLAVAPQVANQGLGRRLIAAGIEEAESADIAIILLVGDKPYYERFGFDQVPPGQILLPGPVDPSRILAWQAKPDTMGKFTGMTAAA